MSPEHAERLRRWHDNAYDTARREAGDQTFMYTWSNWPTRPASPARCWAGWTSWRTAGGSSTSLFGW